MHSTSGNVYKHICIQGLTHISCTQLRVLTPSLLSIHICASFGSTRARFPSTYTCHTPRTHAHISSHTCKPCALHAPRSTESPVHFFVRSHGAEALTFLPGCLLFRHIHSGPVRLPVMAKLPLAAVAPRGQVIPANVKGRNPYKQTPRSILQGRLHLEE